MIKKIGRIPGPWRWSELALEAKYDENALARLCRRSTRQLRRQSQRHVGMTLHGWLDTLRIVEARQRLLAGQIPKEFAGELGFKHELDFRRYFKRCTGVTPIGFVALIKS